MKDHPETMTLPRWFREHGYQTAKVGKVQHTDEYEGPLDWDLILKEKPVSNKGAKTIRYKNRAGAELGYSIVRPDSEPTIDQARAEAFADFISNQWSRTQPFFFALGLHSPHAPWDVQQKHLNLHPAERISLPAAPEGATPMTKPPRYAGHCFAALFDGSQEMRDRLAASFPAIGGGAGVAVDDLVQKQMTQAYDAAVSMMDEMTGRVLQLLEQQGLAENTLVVFTSDQGYFLGYRNLWSKHYLYPEVLRVPLIVRAPGLTRTAGRAGGVVELLDLFPTLCELAGLSIPDGLDGTSFVPLLRDPEREGKAAAYAEGILYGGQAVITRDWLCLDWAGGKRFVPTGLRAEDGKDPADVLSRLACETSWNKDIKIHLAGSQRWIDIEVDLAASREFYHIGNDPKAWFDLSGNPTVQTEMLRHLELLKRKFGRQNQGVLQ
jgi:arylsulfatase A-like enzyme